MRAGGWALIWCPYKKWRWKHRLTPEEDGHVQAKETSLKKHPTNTLIFDRLCPWLWRNKFLSFKTLCCCCLVAEWCPSLCDPRDCSLPDSSVHEILQVRILEWPGLKHQGARGWCTGITLRDGMEREVGGGFRMGNTHTLMADSCQCMAKTIIIL